MEFQKGTLHDPTIFLGKLHSLWFQYCSRKNVACTYLRLFEKKKSVSATGISLMASLSGFIFFPAIAKSTYNSLPYLHSPV
jgi:hypothetical protein